nr:DNA-deoxyinosine glycosylase [uncultured Bacteroides sp.]
MERIKSMPAIADKRSRVLILGTMPGKESLEYKEYYRHVDNLFWDIMLRICDKDWPMFEDASQGPDYDTKVKLLLDNGIALWNIVESCEREGNSDDKIKNPQFNDLETFILDHPNISKIGFNGKKVSNSFKASKMSLSPDIIFKTLYSTSPSSPVNSFSILKQWYEYIRK